MIALIFALGAGPAMTLSQGAGSGAGALVIARRALWFGLSIFLVAGMFLNLFLPMASPITFLVIVVEHRTMGQFFPFPSRKYIVTVFSSFFAVS